MPRPVDTLSTSFLTALAAIVVIDLVLAGDNAIVIALAARGLPEQSRRRAILWGTFGAVAVRTALTVAVVQLLRIPGLLAVGGTLLVAIAYKLLVQPDEAPAAGHEVAAAGSFWAAMKTIVVADALMGLDNVLAVAGAAHGSLLLVVLGLLVSVPIVVWGSQLVLKLVERFPVVVYLGSGILAWTAVKMVASEPLLAGIVEANAAAVPLASFAVVGGVLSAGFMANYRPVRRRIAAHVVDPGGPGAACGAHDAAQAGRGAPARPLVPLDGSQNGLDALGLVLGRSEDRHDVEVHLLQVTRPARSQRHDPGRHGRSSPPDAADHALARARQLLRASGVGCVVHVEPGPRAEAISRVAERIGATEIVIGTARSHSVTRVIEDGIWSKVIGAARVPVRIVPGRAIPALERVGLPAGAVALAALALAAVA